MEVSGLTNFVACFILLAFILMFILLFCFFNLFRKEKELLSSLTWIKQLSYWNLRRQTPEDYLYPKRNVRYLELQTPKIGQV